MEYVNSREGKMRYKIVKQRSIKDCGPCSLASIIMYYKGYISVNTLSLMMNTTKDGTTALDIVDTAKKLGFDAKGVKVNNIFNVKLPCICHFNINGYYHFVVLYEIDKKGDLIIGDPATGIVKYNLDKFYSL